MKSKIRNHENIHQYAILIHRAEPYLTPVEVFDMACGWFGVRRNRVIPRIP